MQPTPTYPTPGAPDGGPPAWWGYPPAPWGTSPTPPWPAAPWWTLPAPRPPRSRKQITVLVAVGVLAVAVLAGVIAAAVAMGRAAGDRMATSGGMAADVPLAAVPTSPPVPATGLGDDPGLDGYARRCHDGLFSACDDLYELSPPMSRYEQYGMTCAGRVKPFDVTYCTDLQFD